MWDIYARYLLAISGALIFIVAQSSSMPAAAQQCGPDEVLIDCGRGPQCATAPAVCCYGQTCGAGMVCTQTARGPECGVPKVTRCGIYTCGEGMTCVQTARGPECGVPKVTRCGIYTCGEGMACVQTPRGPECAMPPAGDLGRTWNEQELGWHGVWTRLGNSNQFSATWTRPGGGRETALMTMTVRGANVTILRDQGQRGSCRYKGIMTSNGLQRSVTGSYGCDWAPGPFPWSATIQ